jgi:hypothetical protein
MGVSVGPVASHDIVQGHSPRLEAPAGFGVVSPAEETHAFGHGVTVVPRRTEGVFLD